MIMSIGAIATYIPNGAFSPSSYVIILGIIKKSNENTIFDPTITKLNKRNLQNFLSLIQSMNICIQEARFNSSLAEVSKLYWVSADYL